jgi:hypothetical protein
MVSDEFAFQVYAFIIAFLPDIKNVADENQIDATGVSACRDCTTGASGARSKMSDLPWHNNVMSGGNSICFRLLFG